MPGQMTSIGDGDRLRDGGPEGEDGGERQADRQSSHGVSFSSYQRLRHRRDGATKPSAPDP
jgi:hypothetical protein